MFEIVELDSMNIVLDVSGVTLGGVLGHLVCTTAAVMGGRHFATSLSERMVGVSACKSEQHSNPFRHGVRLFLGPCSSLIVVAAIMNVLWKGVNFTIID